MEMTPAQIASEYRTGKDKTKTIKVLAELNLATQRQIAEILQEQGETLPGHWIEKLAQPLQRKPRGRALTTEEVDAAILEAVVPGGDDTSSAAQSAAPSPQGEGRGTALSLDEIRQAALTLILEAAPSEPERFQGFARGVAALAAALEERTERR